MNLIFVIHNHQPVGNFGFVFEEAYRKAYLPFWELLESAPHVKMGLHISGPLLDFFQREHPDFIERVGRLVAEGRVELLGGGLYEPILTIVPTRDAIGQLDAMGDRLRELFGVRQRGMWLAERVWEPELPALLGPTEIDYTLVDDSLFAYSGVPAEKCVGYWITESKGMPLKIFPISMKLRYLLPFKPVHMVKEYFQELHQRDSEMVVTFGDDGEKFGIWPETYEWVYGEKWLEKFFSFLADESGWVKTQLPSEYLSSAQPEGRIYLPQASYEEMLEWALPTQARLAFKRFKDDLKRCGIYEAGRPFLRGGIWPNFISKYPEGDWMHKRMISISKLFPDRKDGEDKRWADARSNLYRAQCNCAYWHGLFGGLYLNYLRHGVWQNLIAAERAAREIRGEKDAETFVASDLNLDGVNEHIFENKDMYIAITPAQGASVAEIDLRPWNFNLTNVMMRREEAFHVEFMEKSGDGHKTEGVKTIHEISRAKVEGLDKLLQFDPAPRYSFQDFIPWAVLGDAADGAACKVIEWRGAMPTGWRIIGEGKFAGIVRLQTDEGWLIVEVIKRYRLKGPTISCLYEIQSDWPGDFGFATHFNLTLLAGHADDRYLTANGKKLDPAYMDAEGCIPDLETIELHDKWLGLKVEIIADPPVECLEHYPIITVSSSEDGLEPTYQGTCFSFLRRISRLGKTKTRFEYRLTAKREG